MHRMPSKTSAHVLINEIFFNQTEHCKRLFLIESICKACLLIQQIFIKGPPICQALHRFQCHKYSKNSLQIQGVCEEILLLKHTCEII